MVRANQLAYQYIKERILDGTLRPAQRLVEIQLSEEIGVSRNTLKKALLQLSEEHLVVLEDNKGAVVASLTIDEIEQYYEIRKALEVIVVGSAARLISDEDLKTLRTIFEEMSVLKEKGDFVNYSANNKKFHNVIYAASRKTVAVDRILEIKNMLGRFNLRTMMAPGRSDKSICEHQSLLEALERHDEDAAIDAIKRHLDNVVCTIVEYKSLFY